MLIYEVNPCGTGKQVIESVNVSFLMNDQCEVYSSSCAKVHPYKLARVWPMNLSFHFSMLTIFLFTSRWTSKFLWILSFYWTGIKTFASPKLCQIWCGFPWAYLEFPSNVQSWTKLFIALRARRSSNSVKQQKKWCRTLLRRKKPYWGWNLSMT